jgi:hypothetical protein
MQGLPGMFFFPPKHGFLRKKHQHAGQARHYG